MNVSSGIILSPGYPQDYPVNQRLTWIVHGATEGTSLRVIDMQLDKNVHDYLLIGRGKHTHNHYTNTSFHFTTEQKTLSNL